MMIKKLETAVITKLAVLASKFRSAADRIDEFAIDMAFGRGVFDSLFRRPLDKQPELFAAVDLEKAVDVVTARDVNVRRSLIRGYTTSHRPSKVIMAAISRFDQAYKKFASSPAAKAAVEDRVIDVEEK